MALNIPAEFQYRYEQLVARLNSKHDLEKLDEGDIISLLMHPDEVIVISPVEPAIQLDGIIDCYWVYDQTYAPLYQIADHRGFFGENPIELAWILSLPAMTIFHVRYLTEEGERILMVLRK